VTAFSLREVAGGGFSRNLPAGAPIPPNPEFSDWQAVDLLACLAARRLYAVRLRRPQDEQAITVGSIDLMRPNGPSAFRLSGGAGGVRSL
jgi:hypothetical protein